MGRIEEGDLVLIVHKERKYLKRVIKGRSFEGRGGRIDFSNLSGRPFGIRYGEYEIYKPTIEDYIMYGLKRQTQIIYPKDSFFIGMKMDLKRGSKVLEIGTGSGALTIVLSRIVGEEGLVVSFETDERQFKNAKKNIETFSESKNIRLLLGGIEGFEEKGFDAAFIDIKEPWLYIEKIYDLLKEEGILGVFVPTTNQIIEVLRHLDRRFGAVEVLEILHRKYKTVAERLRPEDRMVAHTGYILFARRLTELQTS